MLLNRVHKDALRSLWHYALNFDAMISAVIQFGAIPDVGLRVWRCDLGVCGFVVRVQGVGPR